MNLALLSSELHLLRRDSTAFVTAVALPLVIGGMWIVGDPPIGDGVGALTVIQLMVMLAFTLHSVGVMVLASRREAGVLRRWRVSGASDAAILGGTLGVPAGLAILQAWGLTAVTAVLWGVTPGRIDLVVLGTLLGTAVLIGWTVVAAAFTRSAEHSMITTFPVVMLLIFGTTFALTRPLEAFDAAVLAIPVGPAIQLLRAGWETGAATGSTVAVAVAAGAVHTLISAAAAWVYFRWSPAHAEEGGSRNTAAADRVTSAARGLVGAGQR